MADKYAGHVHASLRDMGFHVRVDKTSKNEVGLERGRSDLLLSRAGKSVAIELKYGPEGFRYTTSNEDSSGWRPNQRQWAKWLENQIGSEYWIWLQAGKGQPHWKIEKKPRKSYLFPRSVGIQIIRTIKAHQKILPYRADKGKCKHFQENGIDCEHLLSEWECEYIGSSRWRVPDHHPFFKKFMETSNGTENHDEQRPVRKRAAGCKRHFAEAGKLAKRRRAGICSESPRTRKHRRRKA